MNSLLRTFASVEGAAIIHAQPRPFIAAFARRIESGLFQGPRSNYLVVGERADRLRFHAADWRTALSVGLNEVDLTLSPEGRVLYTIRYPRWAGYALALCAVIGVVIMAILLIAGQSEWRVPGLSMGANVPIAWAMALFWGFVWPWLLIAIHKRPLRVLMAKLVAEVDAVARQ